MDFNKIGVLLVSALAAIWTNVSLAADGSDVAKQTARATTEAVTRGTIYQINLRAFTSEGSLKAAQARLPKLAELGVTIVYLCPFMVSDDDMRREFWSPRQKKSGMDNPCNPYRIKDFYRVDPEYGTEADLKAFVDAAHALGMNVMFDLVYLHCGPTAVFIEEHPDFVKRDAQGRILNAGWSFPGLNFESAELREYLWKNMEYWVREFDVDGYRLDVGDGVPLDFWAEGRRRLDAIKPGFMLLSEGTRAEDQLDVMDLNYGFPFFSALCSVMSGKKPAREISENWKATAEARPKGARFTRYSDNHDISNDDYENRREKIWGDDANRTILALIFAMDGTPMLYNGQEIADASRHSIFGKAPIDWTKEESAAGRERFEFVKSLIRQRREHSALTSPDIVWISPNCSESCLAFLRKSDDETILCVFNMTKEFEHEKHAFPQGVSSVEPLLCNGGVVLGDKELTADLPPYGYVVLKLK